MLDTLGNEVFTMAEIKKILKFYLNKEVTIKCSLGRNKYESDRVVIKELYNSIFTVENKNNQTKSFSYADIITKTIKITE